MDTQVPDRLPKPLVTGSNPVGCATLVPKKLNGHMASMKIFQKLKNLIAQPLISIKIT